MADYVMGASGDFPDLGFGQGPSSGPSSSGTYASFPRPKAGVQGGEGKGRGRSGYPQGPTNPNGLDGPSGTLRSYYPFLAGQYGPKSFSVKRSVPEPGQWNHPDDLKGKLQKGSPAALRWGKLMAAQRYSAVGGRTHKRQLGQFANLANQSKVVMADISRQSLQERNQRLKGMGIKMRVPYQTHGRWLGQSKVKNIRGIPSFMAFSRFMPMTDLSAAIAADDMGRRAGRAQYNTQKARRNPISDTKSAATLFVKADNAGDQKTANSARKRFQTALIKSGGQVDARIPQALVAQLSQGAQDYVAQYGPDARRAAVDRRIAQYENDLDDHYPGDLSFGPTQNGFARVMA